MDYRQDWVNNKSNVCYVNERFFDKWTPKMAYVLGFFAADGCLTINQKRGNKYIEFVSTDYDIIKKIKSTLLSEHKISSRKRGPNNKISYRLQIGSKHIYNNLVGLGFMPNKSKVLKFPDVPIKYISDFIRGYFDGDGHCYFSKSRRKDRKGYRVSIISGFTSGSEEFLNILKSKLEKFTTIKGGTFHFHDAYRLVYSTRNSKKLFEFMYEEVDKSIYLKRKYSTFKKAFANFGLVV